MLLFLNHLLRGETINGDQVLLRYRINESVVFINGHRLLLLEELAGIFGTTV